MTRRLSLITPNSLVANQQQHVVISISKGDVISSKIEVILRISMIHGIPRQHEEPIILDNDISYIQLDVTPESYRKLRLITCVFQEDASSAELLNSGGLYTDIEVVAEPVLQSKWIAYSSDINLLSI